MEKLEYQVREILSEELEDQDEEGRYSTYFDEFDYELVGSLYLDISEEDSEDYIKLADCIENSLRDEGFISKKQQVIIEGDIVSLKVLSCNNYKPLYEIILQ